MKNSGLDAFFTAQEQQRLQHLMAQWRASRDSGGTLPDLEQSELNSLIDAELEAASKRTAELIRELPK